MVQSVIQTSFHAGEWAPALNARVDLAKYKAGAALLRNFFVDYRGGASSRPGTKYVLRAYKSSTAVWLIPFQASSTVGYSLEFGDVYIRFHFQGAPVLEATIAITNVSGSTVTATNTYAVGDWVYITGVGGITNINGKYFIIASATGANFTVTDLYGVSVTFTGSYTSGGTAARVYTLPSPYLAADLSTLKFTQNVDKLYITHVNYAPRVLTLISAANWTLATITLGATVSTPTGLAASTTNAGTSHYAYRVTAFDGNGQESVPSAVVNSTTANGAGSIATINLTWTAVAGAVAYGVYRSPESHNADPPTGVAFGLITTTTLPNADDTFYSNAPTLPADFSISPPVGKNPLLGGGVDHATITAAGTYTSVPGVSFAAAPAGGLTATGTAVLGILSVTGIGGGGTGFQVGNIFKSGDETTGGATVKALTVDGFGAVLTVAVINPGSITSGSTPSNPVTFNKISGGGSFGFITGNATWGVISITITQAGYGYISAPAITFSAGAATATAVLQASGAGNPAVVGLFQQRLVFAAKPTSVQTFDMSQPGSYYNFNVSNPVQADDAINASLVSGDLNAIQSMVSVPTGLILLTNKANWLVTSGSGNSAVTPIDIAAHAHSYNGASGVRPIVANFDILFVQAKGSIVRDLTFNFYTQIYTGTDISVLSSHLFYGHTIPQWAWAEEPYKVVWAVRDDGVMLHLTFLKEQDLIGWSHSDTQGLFKSVAVVTEQVAFGLADAVYTVVERTINGQTVKYIERVAERLFTNGARDAWCVDAGLQYTGSPATSFSGAEHLAGATVTGLADGVVIPPFTMPTSGNFTLGTPASKVTVGLAFTPQLQTLQLDTGDPTIQGKRKGINGVTVRVQETLGLSIGKSFDSVVPMKDLIVGNIGSQTNGMVTGLLTGDARTIIDPSWDVQGQYCIQQSSPLPATILGVIPEIGIGDSK